MEILSKRYIRKGDIINFCRNILNDKNRRKLWIEVPQYFRNLNYLDGIEDLDITTGASNDLKQRHQQSSSRTQTDLA